MHSLRKWFYKPKKEDNSKLASFYWADEELTMVATELDSFDGRTDPDRCSVLVSQLRVCQDKVLSICNEIMDDAIPNMRANRDFRAKFPDDVLHENLAGQLWFGAECLAAGSNIIHRELESASMRPLAKALTRALDNVRCLLREQSLKNSFYYSDKVKEALRIFDRLFAEFELCYVSAMVPIKSAKEYHLQQEIVVLFSETLIRALKIELVKQEMVDDYDPSLMFTIPRLAIVWGLLIFPEGPFNVDREPSDMSELFRPFCSLLFKIRDLLCTLTRAELSTLESMLCSQEEPKIDKTDEKEEVPIHTSEDYISKFYESNSNCKQFIQDFYAYNFGIFVGEDNSRDADEVKDISISGSKATDTIDSKSENMEVKLNNSFDVQVHQNSADNSCDDTDAFVSPEFDACESNSSLNYFDQNLNNEEGRSELYSYRDVGSHFLSGSDGLNTGSKQHRHLNSIRTSSDDLEQVQQDCVPLCSCQPFAKCDGCSFSANIEQATPSMQDTLALEHHLKKLHSSCTCDVTPRHSSSRDLVQQVMRRVEIVPPGQPISGYSSSPEGSPRAYHHGLMSHSFPVNSVYDIAGGTSGSPRHMLASAWFGKMHKSSQHHFSHNTSRRLNCDTSPCLTPYRHSAGSSVPRHNSSHGAVRVLNSSPLMIPQVQRLRNEEFAPNSDATYSSCSSCQSVSSVSSPEWDTSSPETSSYNSECQDDEEIALALQAAEIASRNKARCRFKSSKDLLHKLFVCVSGVADQLQTNYASDLRNILKSVFYMNCSHSSQHSVEYTKTKSELSLVDDSVIREPVSRELGTSEENNTEADVSVEREQYNFSTMQTDELLQDDDHIDDDDRDKSSLDSAEEAVPESALNSALLIRNGTENDYVNNEANISSDPPTWLPDELSSHCMACKVPFTILRRRHHCRNCGKIFCSRCSSNSIPLPRFGHLKPVRVCNQCFMYQLTSLVMQQQL